MRRRRSIDPSMGSIDRSTARSMSTSMGSIDRSIDRSIDTLKREYIPCSDIRRVLVVYRRLSSHARTHMGASIARVRARAHERSRATQTQTHTHTHTGCRRRRRPRRRDGCFCGRLDADRTDGRTRDGALEMDDPARAKSGVDGIPWLGARASD